VPDLSAGNVLSPDLVISLSQSRFVFGVAIEAGADFTSSVSGLLVSLVILAALGFMIQRNHARLTTAKS
jgi:hypothetical protein